MSYYPHVFEAEIVPHNVGYLHTVVFLPPQFFPQLPLDKHPRLRISGEINNYPFEGAWQPVRGRWYLMLSKKLLKQTGLAIGDIAEVRFRVEDQDAVDVPEELSQAIATNDAVQSYWDSISSGKKRGLAYYVSSAKRAATRERRVNDVMAALQAKDTNLRNLGKHPLN